MGATPAAPPPVCRRLSRLLPLLAAWVATSAAAPCARTAAACRDAVADGRFAGAAARLAAAAAEGPAALRVIRADADALAVVCNRRHWAADDVCRESCEVELEIMQPRGVQMTACVEVAAFTHGDAGAGVAAPTTWPTTPAALAAPATPEGCRATDYTPAQHAGKIVVIARGGCFFHQKFAAAAAAGAVGAVLVNSDASNSMAAQRLVMTGDAGGVPRDFPAAAMPRQSGGALLEALAAGQDVRGRWAPPPPCTADADASDASSVWRGVDVCPHPPLGAVCDAAAAADDQLCTRCPLSLTVAADGNAASRVVCLWGNSLTPRNPATLFPSTPDTLDANSVIWPTTLPDEGCSPSAYLGLRGKVAMIAPPGICPPHQAARLAAAAGVRGIILRNHGSMGSDDPIFVEGPSSLVAMPVHSLDFESTQILEALAMSAAGGVAWTSVAGARGFAYTDTFRIEAGTAADDAARLSAVAAMYPGGMENTSVADSAWASTAKLQHIPEFQLTVGVVLGLLVMMLLVPVLIVVHLRQRANAVIIPDKILKSGGFLGQFTISAGLASMALSMVWLVIIAIVAFNLAYTAGRDATTTAVRDGENAATLTHRNAVESVEALAAHIRSGAFFQIEQEVLGLLAAGQAAATSAAMLHIGFDASWASFARSRPAFLELARSLHPQWETRVHTTNGFFISDRASTDDRANRAARGDANADPVATTNEGWRYGMYELYYDPTTRASVFWRATPGWKGNYSELVGHVPGDPLAVVADSARGTFTWVANTRSVLPPSAGAAGPTFAVFTPLFNRAGVYLGAVSAAVAFDVLEDLTHAIATATGQANMTIVLFNRDDKTVIATNAASRRIRAQIWRDGEYHAMYGHYTVYDTPAPQVRAFARHLQTTGYRWATDTTAVFDQANYTAVNVLPRGTLLDVRASASGGAAVDGSDEQHDTTRTGGACGDCIAIDATTNAQVLQCDGGVVWRVSKNLTTVVPDVRATRMSADPVARWASVYPEYATVLEGGAVAGAHPCVAAAYQDEPGDPVRTRCLLREPWPSTDAFTIHAVFNPSTFSGALLRDPHFALLPDGRLYVYAAPHTTGDYDAGAIACATPAAAVGALPVGRWASVTAVISTTSTRRQCTVYINGAPHNETPLGEEFRYVETGVDYAVGAGFTGMIGRVAVFRDALAAADVVALHASTASAGRDAPVTAQRTIPSATWFADVGVLKTADRTRRGAEWGAFSMMPRADILGRVEYANTLTMHNLAVHDTNTKRLLDQKSTETMIAVAVLTCAFVLVFLVFNDILTRPFSAATIVLADCAALRVDENVADKATRSLLRELTAMNRAMTIMCNNMREYRAFIPPSRWIEEGLDDDAEEEAGFDAQEVESESDGEAGESQATGSLALPAHHSGGLAAAVPTVSALRRRPSPAAGLARRDQSTVAFVSPEQKGRAPEPHVAEGAPVARVPTIQIIAGSPRKGEMASNSSGNIAGDLVEVAGGVRESGSDTSATEDAAAAAAAGGANGAGGSRSGSGAFAGVGAKPSILRTRGTGGVRGNLPAANDPQPAPARHAGFAFPEDAPAAGSSEKQVSVVEGAGNMYESGSEGSDGEDGGEQAAVRTDSDGVDHAQRTVSILRKPSKKNSVKMPRFGSAVGLPDQGSGERPVSRNVSLVGIPKVASSGSGGADSERRRRASPGLSRFQSAANNIRRTSRSASVLSNSQSFLRTRSSMRRSRTGSMAESFGGAKMSFASIARLSVVSQTQAQHRRSIVSISKTQSALVASRTVELALQRAESSAAQPVLTRKAISFLHCNVREWMHISAQLTDAEMVAMHTKFLDVALDVIGSNRGIPETFCGDRLSASFNAVANCADHRIACAASAVDLRRSIAEETNGAIALSMSCVSGEAHVGNLGCPDLMRYSFFSTAIPWGAALERIGNKHDIGIMIDSFTYNNTWGVLNIKILRDVSFPKRSRLAHIRIAELDSVNCNDDGEWMYAGGSPRATGPWATWNAFAEAVLDGRWEVAMHLREQAQHANDGEAFAVLEQMLDDEDSSPLELLFH